MCVVYFSFCFVFICNISLSNKIYCWALPKIYRIQKDARKLVYSIYMFYSIRVWWISRQYCCLFVCSRPSRSVTPHTQVDFKVWSHNTLKADALLGKATLDLMNALEQHDRKCMIKYTELYCNRILPCVTTVPQNSKSIKIWCDWTS